MNKDSRPIDYVLSCCEQGLVPELFSVLNAKDELNKLRKELNSFKVVAYGKINDKYDLYSVSINYNPYDDETKIVHLYSNRAEFQSQDWKGCNYVKSNK